MFYFDGKFTIRMVAIIYYELDNIDEVTIRGLRSRALYQTRQDWTRLETNPELPGSGRYYKCLVLLLGTIREKYGKKSGRDGTAQYHLGKVLNGLEMN